MKSLVLLGSIIIMSPITFLYFLVSKFSPGDSTFSGFSQLVSLLPGKTGNYLRVGFFRFSLEHCADDCVISFLVQFAQRDTEVNSGVYIGPQCNIGSCHIKRNTLLGSGVHVMSGKSQHIFKDLETPIKDQGGTFEKISIGEDCWIGNGALIMANIGNHCIIGAGSVVNQDIPDYAVVAGNPARVLKLRKAN